MNRRGFLRGAAFLSAVATLPRLAAVDRGARPLLRVAVMSDIQGYPYPEDARMRNLRIFRRNVHRPRVFVISTQCLATVRMNGW